MVFGEKRRVPLQPCVNCGSKNDALSQVDPGFGVGSFSICIGCGLVACVGEGMILRPLTPQEAISFASDERAVRLAVLIQRAAALRKAEAN